MLSIFVDNAAANESSDCKYYIKFSTILLKLLELVETTIEICHVLQFHVLQYHVLHFYILQFHSLQI